MPNAREDIAAWRKITARHGIGLTVTGVMVDRARAGQGLHPMEEFWAA